MTTDHEPRERSVTTPARTHRVHVFAGRVHEVLDDVLGPHGSAAVSGLSAAEVREALVELTRAQHRIDALRTQLVVRAEATDAAAEAGATSTAAWLAGAVVTPPGRARDLVRLAGRLETRYDATARALAAGRLDAEQARVIADAVDALGPCVGEADRRRAEGHLVDEAARHDARELRLLGRHLREVVDPDGADAALAARLEAEEAAAAVRTSLSMGTDRRGVCHGTFRLPVLHGAMLAAALEAFVSPRRPDSLVREEPDAYGVVRPVPRDELLGRAFCELLERLPADRLPQSGGSDATVVVTMTLETLLGGLGVATLSTGRQLSAGEARRLACRAGVVPMVLGSDSVVLDAGRKVRLHTATMRAALRVQHPTCAAEGCTIPAAWCDAHHRRPWAEGGGTSVRDGTLLCPRHHTLAHLPDREVTYLDTGRARITTTARRRC